MSAFQTIVAELQQPHTAPFGVQVNKGFDDATKILAAFLVAYLFERFKGFSDFGAALASLGVGVIVVEFIFQTLFSRLRGAAWPWQNKLRLYDKFTDSAMWLIPLTVLAAQASVWLAVFLTLGVFGFYLYGVYQQGTIRANRKARR